MEQFQIVKLFVRGNLAWFGNRKSLGEEKAAAVAGIADAFGNIRAPGEPRGVKGILQKKSHVEFLCAKFRREMLAAGKSGVHTLKIVGDELIEDPLVPVNVR